MIGVTDRLVAWWRGSMVVWRSSMVVRQQLRKKKKQK